MSTNLRLGNDPRDFLDVDGLLDEEELAIRATVRRFVDERVLPGIAEWYDAGTFPRDLAKEMGTRDGEVHFEASVGDTSVLSGGRARFA